MTTWNFANFLVRCEIDADKRSLHPVYFDDSIVLRLGLGAFFKHINKTGRLDQLFLSLANLSLANFGHECHHNSSRNHV